MRHQKRRKRGRAKNLMRKIAQERMIILLDAVDRVARGNIQLMQRYADLARKIAMKSRTALPREWRYRICRRCKTFLQPGRNCRVRTRTKRESHVSLTCLECGWITRYGISDKKKYTEYKK
jgi:ribonuclease P protein subunit RPR2